MPSETMEIILTQDIPNIGRAGDLKRFKLGFVRNYIFPRNLGVRAAGNAEKWEALKKRQAKQQAIELANSQSLLDQLKDKTITLVRKVHDTTQLYGGVHVTDIIAALVDQHGIEITKQNVRLDAEIKTIGSFPVTIHLPAGDTTVTVTVTAEG